MKIGKVATFKNQQKVRYTFWLRKAIVGNTVKDKAKWAQGKTYKNYSTIQNVNLTIKSIYLDIVHNVHNTTHFQFQILFWILCNKNYIQLYAYYSSTVLFSHYSGNVQVLTSQSSRCSLFRDFWAQYNLLLWQWLSILKQAFSRK